MQSPVGADVLPLKAAKGSRQREPARLAAIESVNKPRKHGAGSSPSGLGELLALALQARESWTPEELEAALEEQVSAPVQFELSALKQGDAKALQAQAQAHGLVLKSLNDLFTHPKPPLPLLVMSKEFFKANIDRPQPGLPAEVAQALYYLSIAAAWLRHHKRISSLSDAQLLSAMEWVREQRWISDELLSLAEQTTKSLSLEKEETNGTQ